MSRCAICTNEATERTLCGRCSERLTLSYALCAEQVASHAREPTSAALVDQWGRLHMLGRTMLVGRQLSGDGLTLIESSVSRHHAELVADDAGHEFTVRDLGSTNGTCVGDDQISDPVVLANSDTVFFGNVGFYFVANAEELSTCGPMVLAQETIKPSRELASSVSRTITKVGLIEMQLRIVEPTGGGGGYLETTDKHVQLTTTQFELVKLLIDRMRDEHHQPEPVRGYVRSSELIAVLSWDTAHPTDNHVKQLVRRTRKALTRAGIGNLIHSQHRFGYRLRVIPADPTPP